jgi:hypothetical protein
MIAVEVLCYIRGAISSMWIGYMKNRTRRMQDSVGAGFC